MVGNGTHSRSASCARRAICYSSAVTYLPKRRDLLLLTSLLALQMVGVACLPYAKRSFKGPATVTDTGMFSYPRYHFLFSPKLPLRLKGDQTYQYRGVPTDEMTLSFAVVPFDVSQVHLLTSLTTVLSVEMRDEGGNLICLASGRLSESLHGTSVKDTHGRWTDNHWILEYSATNGNFWNAACTDIKMDHRRSYVLTVKLDQIDPRTPDQVLIPKIEGGGNELP
jgi:hypothetical protein